MQDHIVTKDLQTLGHDEEHATEASNQTPKETEAKQEDSAKLHSPDGEAK